MKILADKRIYYQIVRNLREDGYTVLYIPEIGSSISDDDVLDLANKESALLLTADTDFGELVFHQHRFAAGVVLARLKKLRPRFTIDVVCKAFREHGSEFKHRFTVITPWNIRLRELP